MTTFTVNIVLSSESASDVEAYIRDCIDNADEDWGVESATMESDGVTTDLLEDEEDLSDEPDEPDTAQEAAEETRVKEEGKDQETPSEDAITSQPTGKEF